LKRIGKISLSDKGVFLLPGAVEKSLSRDRRISKVSVNRDFRGGLSVKIDEKKPFCLFAKPDGTLFYIDDGGEVIGPAPVVPYGMNFPVLSASPGFVRQGVLALNFSHSALSAPSWDDISEVVVRDGEGFEIFTRGGARIEIGTNLKAQWEKLEKMTRDLNARGLEAKYINLRNEGVGIINLRKKGG